MELNEVKSQQAEVNSVAPENLCLATEQVSNVKYEQKHTKEEVIQRLKEIDADICNADKQEIDLLKQTFYKLHKAEQDVNRKLFVENGGDADSFVPQPDPMEEELRSIMSSIKEKRNSILAEQEKEKEENLNKKLEILEKMKELSEAGEDAGKNYNEFKQLQQQWNEIKLIPLNKVNEIWKTYQLYTERFYDMLKLNNEFREYDFKKNLEQKTYLCEAAEKLADEKDVVSAFHQLQKLHQEFREIGPVAKETAAPSSASAPPPAPVRSLPPGRPSGTGKRA